MNIAEFQASLTRVEPPDQLTPALAALWWDAKGDGVRAHDSAQEDKNADGSWVHAYLHRKEADQSNAAYWYDRAKKSVCEESLEAERLSIVKDLLQRG